MYKLLCKLWLVLILLLILFGLIAISVLSFVLVTTIWAKVFITVINIFMYLSVYLAFKGVIK